MADENGQIEAKRHRAEDWQYDAENLAMMAEENKKDSCHHFRDDERERKLLGKQFVEDGDDWTTRDEDVSLFSHPRSYSKAFSE